MFKPSSNRALCQSLFLIAAIVLQSLAFPGRGVVYAYAPDPATKTAPPSGSTAPAPEKIAAPRPEQTPNAPQAAAIVATLTDNVTAATKIAPGANINYTATITNNGAVVGTDDATNLSFSAPLDANTTLVGGSIHASPIARNDTYNWIGNTQLDTAARSLSSVVANDVAVNATGGTDTFTVTAIAGGATSLGGTVTLASPSGAFTYTPPLNRPNLADGASVNDTFTYTITNSADPSLTSTGTVTITLTGRVFYLQAGAAGDGRSNTPSASPATMSTNADKATDIFYMFSNAGSLSGLFTVDAGQQLLGQGVNLVVTIPTLGSVTLFSAAAPTPTTINPAGNGVTLAGAPGNNTLSGFNIGNCSALAIQGANVGTLAINTLSINTTGGGVDLTGVSTPTVNIVLGGLTATGGTVGANLVGLNGTINLASGTLSGGSSTEFAVSGGAATTSYTGAITQNNAQRVVNIQGTTANSVTLSGTITGGASSLGVHIGDTSAVNGNVAFTTVNLGTAGARMTNQAMTITNGTGTYGLGTFSIFTNNTTGFNASGSDGTINCSSGSSVDSTNGRAMIIDGPAGVTTLGMTMTKVSSTNSASTGLTLQDVGGSFSVIGDNSNTSQGGNASGGTISGVTGADGTTGDDGTSNGIGIGIYLNNATGVQLRRITVTNTSNFGLEVESSPTFTVQYCRFNGTQGDNTGQGEGAVRFLSMTGTTTVDNCEMTGSKANDVRLDNSSVNMTDFIVSNCSLHDNDNLVGNDGIAIDLEGTTTIKTHLTGNSLSNHLGDHIDVTTTDTASADVIITGNTCTGTRAAAPASPGDLGRGIRIFSSAFNSPALIRYNISNNNLTGTVQGGAIHVTAGGPGTGTFTGQITNNIIGATGVNGSGASQSDGIIVEQNGSGAHTVAITGNNIRQYFQVGINTNVTTPGTNGTMDATITGNTVTEHATTASTQPGVFLNSGNTSGPPPSANAVCFDLKTNTIGAAGTNSGIGSEDFRVRQRFSTTVRLPGYGGGSTDTAAVIAFIQGQNTGSETGSATTQAPGGGFVGGAACGVPSVPSSVTPVIELAMSTPSNAATMFDALASLNGQPTFDSLPAGSSNSAARSLVNEATATTEKPVVASAAPAGRSYRATLRNVMHHAMGAVAGVANTLDSMITPTAYAQESAAPNAPTSGETVTLNTIATFPAGGKSITIKYSATVNTPPLARQVQTQGTVTANGGISVLTDDPEPGGGADPTVTQVDTLLTWNGVTSTDWNTATNWTQPAGGTQYAPGVSNPAINDVVIPNVGNQPNISTTDIGVFSLSLANGRTLTITSPRILTIGGSPGGDLTLDGIITGGFLNLGTGTHVINNAGGTGSMVGGNQATVLSGSTVTLNNNLQMGSLAVNAGGSMNITNRTLSLARAGAALTVPGGATFTTTGSTVILNGGVAQTIAGIAYNNLTINNSIGTNVTGVTLTGNATVNGTLTLTSSDLDTGAFTLTQPNTTASAGVSDVVGTVKRTGGPFAPAVALTFGNPNNRITFNAVGTRPTDVTITMAKASPVTYLAAVQRNYNISQTGGVGFTCTLRLHYLDSELNGNTPETALTLRRGPNWSAVVPGTVDTANNFVEATNVSAFSQWTFSSLAPTATGGAITGRIVDNNGRPVEGAVVRLSGPQSRKMITDANGNYRFDNVETGGFYTVTPSRSNYNFNPFQRQLTQTGNQTEAVFAAESLGDNVNPLDTAEYYVRQQYVDILGREPDEAGFNYWSDQILGCAEDASCARAQRTGVAAAFFISTENQDTGTFLYDAYAGALGRRPGFGEFTADRGQVVGGDNLDAAKTAFARNFVQRGEFLTKYAGATSGDAFVDALIQSAAASGASLNDERANLIEIYNQAGGDTVTGRAAVLRSLADNAAFKQSQYNKAFVLTEYFAYLRRDAEFDGFTFWVNVLNNVGGGDTSNYRGMVCSFTTSLEYQNRFSRITSHSNGECGQ